MDGVKHGTRNVVRIFAVHTDTGFRLWRQTIAVQLSQFMEVIHILNRVFTSKIGSGFAKWLQFCYTTSTTLRVIS